MKNNFFWKHLNWNYTENLEDWMLCSDCFAGERRIKHLGERYLPKTEGQMADPRFGHTRYEAYCRRAVFFNYFAETITAMLGLMHSEDPEAVELPQKLEACRHSCMIDGTDLKGTLRKINFYQLLHGRCGILADPVPDSDGIKVNLYPAERILDWNNGNSPEENNYLLLDESSARRKNGRWEQENLFRVCGLQDGRYYSLLLTPEKLETFDPEKILIPEEAFPSVRGKMLDSIPFACANTNDVSLAISKPPLLPLANVCLALYRGEADYRHALFMQAQSTLFLKGFPLDDPPMMGAGNYIHTESPDAEGSFLEISGAGLQEMRNAQNDLHTIARNMGLSLSSAGANESASALRTRIGLKTSLMRITALTGADALAKVLRDGARWNGCREEDILLKPNLDFSDSSVTTAEAAELWESKQKGLPISERSMHEWLRKNDFTDLAFDAEKAEIRKEKK